MSRVASRAPPGVSIRITTSSAPSSSASLSARDIKRSVTSVIAPSSSTTNISRGVWLSASTRVSWRVHNRPPKRIAAIQAARAGAKTLLLERNSQLGGTTTTGGVSFPGLFDAWSKQIIAGIGWELVRESVELDGGKLPDFSNVPDRHWKNQVRVNQFLYAILAEEKCEQAGVRIAYYEFPQAITATANGWQVTCVGFGTQRTVNCKQIVDFTGGAAVVGLLG
ncbi:MAG: FAD-dependent oxidoreductase, partial [Chloroflexi bacterium]|nr:FAD-dependent oxidoreductase [Chloroflexota bacterium]